MSIVIGKEATPVVQAPAIKDLSAAIESTVKREPREEVRCVHLFDDNYRCNWWVRDLSPGPTYLNVGRIIRSKFFRATMTGEKLVIEDGASGRPQ
jgi:hypothetical protein